MTDPQEQGSQRPTRPDPALRRLDRLVGTWAISGDAQGQVTHEWTKGGFFLIQHVDLEQDGERNTGMEVIGRERGYGASAPSADIKSRFYGGQGDTLTGAWVYPGGGGYATTATRAEEETRHERPGKGDGA